MRASYREASQADLFKKLAQIHRSESRHGSHDDTRSGAVIWQHRDNAGWQRQFAIGPARDTYAYTSVQNSSWERTSLEDDWAELLAAYRKWTESPRRLVYGEKRRQCDGMIEYAVIAEGRYHYGSSIRARCSIEIWKRMHRGDGSTSYEVLHLEHVGEAWGFISEYLEYPPGMLLGLAQADAFKEYKA